MAALANHWPTKRVLVMSHRFELNQQMIKEFESFCGEPVDLEQASYRADRGYRHRIVVASVQTLNSIKKRTGQHRFEKFNPDDFGLIMVDECHRAAAPSYRRVFEHFASNQECCLVGVTATIDRADGIGLKTVFNHVSCDFNMLWGIEHGWLVEPVQLYSNVKGLDFDSISTTKGDLNQPQLRDMVEAEANLHAMTKPFVDVLGTEKQGIFFAASVKQAHRIAELANEYHHAAFGGVSTFAVAVDGKTSPQDPRRRAIVKDFREGRVRALINQGVFTEGFNVPEVSVIGMGQPTKSRMRYAQMLGRGGRPLQGLVDGLESIEDRLAAIKASSKPNFTVIDYTNQSRKHKLVASIDLLYGSTEPKEIIKHAKKLLNKPSFSGTVVDAVKKARSAAIARQKRAEACTIGVDYELVDARTRSLFDISSIEEPRAPAYMRNVSPTEKQIRMLQLLGWSSAQISEMNTVFAKKAIDYAIKHPRTQFARKLNRQRAANSSADTAQGLNGAIEMIRGAKTKEDLEAVGKQIGDDKRAGLEYALKYRPILANEYRLKRDELS